MHRCASGGAQLGFILFLPAEIKHARTTDRTLKGYASQICVRKTSVCKHTLRHDVPLQTWKNVASQKQQYSLKILCKSFGPNAHICVSPSCNATDIYFVSLNPRSRGQGSVQELSSNILHHFSAERVPGSPPPLGCPLPGIAKSRLPCVIVGNKGNPFLHDFLLTGFENPSHWLSWDSQCPCIFF